MEFNPQVTSIVTHFLWGCSNTLRGTPNVQMQGAQKLNREAYYTRVTFRLYVEEADDAANKVSRRREKGVRANLFP